MATINSFNPDNSLCRLCLTFFGDALLQPSYSGISGVDILDLLIPLEYHDINTLFSFQDMNTYISYITQYYTYSKKFYKVSKSEDNYSGKTWFLLKIPLAKNFNLGWVKIK